MKKIFSSKSFIPITLTVICLCILAVCLIINSQKAESFDPDPTSTSDVSDSFTDNKTEKPKGVEPAPVGTKNPVEATLKPSESNQITESQFPAITEEDKDKVIIEFTDPSPPSEAPPETPGTAEEHVDHDSVPTQTPNIDGVPNGGSSTPGIPVPGSVNDQGQIYDSVFGWITPSSGDTVDMDNDGDPNKQVGDMG